MGGGERGGAARGAGGLQRPGGLGGLAEVQGCGTGGLGGLAGVQGCWLEGAGRAGWGIGMQVGANGGFGGLGVRGGFQGCWQGAFGGAGWGLGGLSRGDRGGGGRCSAPSSLPGPGSAPDLCPTETLVARGHPWANPFSHTVPAVWVVAAPAARSLRARSSRSSPGEVRGSPGAAGQSPQPP